MTLRRGEVILIRIDFHQNQSGKLRPAVVLLDTGDDDFVAIPVTSRFRVSEFDIPIRHWAAAGLNVPSTIRVHKPAVVSKSAITRRLGALSDSDQDELNNTLIRAFLPSR